jgi:hypothetical protein
VAVVGAALETLEAHADPEMKNLFDSAALVVATHARGRDPALLSSHSSPVDR